MTKEPGLFLSNPATSQSNLIQYHAWADDANLAEGYADAARRLARSFKAQPWDDVMLLPFLFVWRQAIELSLKNSIKRLAAWRRLNGDTDPALEPKRLKNHLRSQIGHRISKLRDELEDQLMALEAQGLPADVMSTLDLVAEIDDGGTGFRYAGVLDSKGAALNIVTLNERLDRAFEYCGLALDAATNGEG